MEESEKRSIFASENRSTADEHHRQKRAESQALAMIYKRIKHERMNSKLLKLNEPYKVIYAGGKVGRHIATLFTWEEDEEGTAEILESHEYPIIDQGEEFPAGTLVNTEIEDCRVICSYNPKNGITGTNLYWLAGIIEYDFQQLEPSGAEYILKRLQLLDCQIKLPEEESKDENGKPELDENGKKVMTTKWDYTASLWVSLKKGRFEGEREYIVKGNHSNGFYFESMGTADEIFSDLSYQLSVYSHYLLDGIGSIHFCTSDGYLADVFNRLNKKQGIETDYKDIW